MLDDYVKLLHSYSSYALSIHNPKHYKVILCPTTNIIDHHQLYVYTKSFQSNYESLYIQDEKDSLSKVQSTKALIHASSMST